MSKRLLNCAASDFKKNDRKRIEKRRLKPQKEERCAVKRDAHDQRFCMNYLTQKSQRRSAETWCS